MQKSSSYKYIFFFAAMILFGFCSASRAEAAAFSFQTSTAVVHQGQEVDVDILLDPQGETINTVSATITLPDHLVFSGFDDSASVVALWVDDPQVTADGKHITFSGIIPGGFSGQIDPFAPSVRKPGNLLRLVFTGKTPGAGTSSLVGVEAYLNDGEGMRTPVVTGSLSLVVDGLLDWLPTETPPDTIPPLPFTPVVTRDLLLYQNDYVLIFNTKDKESGINHYEVKEGARDWVTAVSPYILQDQTLAGDIQVKAVDRAGNIRIETIHAHKSPVSLDNLGVLLGTILLVTFIIMWVRREKRAHEQA